jgi:hypothetical protein
LTGARNNSFTVSGVERCPRLSTSLDGVYPDLSRWWLIGTSSGFGMTGTFLGDIPRPFARLRVCFARDDAWSRNLAEIDFRGQQELNQAVLLGFPEEAAEDLCLTSEFLRPALGRIRRREVASYQTLQIKLL